MRRHVVRPANWGRVAALLNWPVPMVGPVPLGFLEIFAIFRYPQVRVLVLAGLGVTLVGVIRQGHLVVSIEGVSIRVKNPWRSYTLIVNSSTLLQLELLAYYPAQQVVAVTQGKRRIRLVATGFLETNAQKELFLAMRELSQSTGCVMRVPSAWPTRRLW